LSRTAHKSNLRGGFDTIDTLEECDLELGHASDYIEAMSGRRPRFFAYPWGQASDYLRTEYLPRFGEQMGLAAAFGTKPGWLDQDAERWYLPRFVCGQHWRSSAELVDLLEGKQ
jgi:peptidoglycan/xylan/chitin deacetylase (PgdA/CDA1 family)